MLMVGIRVMRVRMMHWRVRMRVIMRFLPIPGEIMRMPMVFIVGMPVGMPCFLVFMRVLMVLRQVQPRSPRHQRAGQDELPCHGIPHHHGENGAEEWCDGKIGPGARGSYMPQAGNKQGHTDTIRQEADQHRPCDTRQWRNSRSGSESQGQIHSAGHQAFD